MDRYPLHYRIRAALTVARVTFNEVFRLGRAPRAALRDALEQLRTI